MYLEHFKLRATPFGLAPDPRFFFTGSKHQKFLLVLEDRLHSGAALGIFGRQGVGKTSIVLQLKRQLTRDNKVVVIKQPNMIAENLLNYLLMELGLVDSLCSQEDAERRLSQWLLSPNKQNRLIVLVENAHTMPEESVRVLTKLANQAVSKGNIMSVLFSGTPKLAVNIKELGNLKLNGLYELPPLTRKEVYNYLNFRATKVGYFPGDELFTRAVSNRIAQLSEGIPRNIHMLADKALAAAFLAKAPMPMPEHLSNSSESDKENDIAEGIPHIEKWIAAACVLIAALLFIDPARFKSDSGQNYAESIALATPEVAKFKPRKVETYVPPTPVEVIEPSVEKVIDNEDVDAQVVTTLVEEEPPVEIISEPLKEIEAVQLSVDSLSDVVPSYQPSNVMEAKLAAEYEAIEKAAKARSEEENARLANRLKSNSTYQVDEQAELINEPDVEPSISAITYENADKPALAVAPEIIEPVATADDSEWISPYTKDYSGLSALARSEENLINWLLDAEPNAGTIQILLVKGGEDTEIESYLRDLSSQLDHEQIMVYRGLYNNQPHFGVLYQQFSNRQQAYRAKSALPSYIQALGPFITRTAKGVEDEQVDF